MAAHWPPLSASCPRLTPLRMSTVSDTLFGRFIQKWCQTLMVSDTVAVELSLIRQIESACTHPNSEGQGSDPPGLTPEFALGVRSVSDTSVLPIRQNACRNPTLKALRPLPCSLKLPTR
ncbi:hypothetical protein GCM10007387_43970 [Pseudoduganella albidiflava]|uniref:Uncharacterized protein n=1 Tax=Pseudoduganella albidiflava TaxID=321983 RepID=A0AA87XZT2_9BURK|nr:hypothetical protein GCM10007387_43970 [Pseudoduganella albidiflava]